MDIDGPQMEVKQDAEPRQPASAAPLVPQELMKTYYGQCPDAHLATWLQLLFNLFMIGCLC